MNFPADYEQWGELACKHYPLRQHLVETDELKLSLYSSSFKPGYFTNAPYLEEGGLTLKNTTDKNIDARPIAELVNSHDLEYVLIKTRDELLFDSSVNTQVDTGYCTFLLDLPGRTRSAFRSAEEIAIESAAGVER